LGERPFTEGKQTLFGAAYIWLFIKKELMG
jgi:hypothetical protein